MKAIVTGLAIIVLGSGEAFSQRQSAEPTTAPPPLIRTAPIPDTVPSRLTITVDGRSLILEGPIGRGTASRFEALVNSVPGLQTVVLHSLGGLMDEAERVAQVIREKDLNTYVEGSCISACTIVLIAGRDRAASPRARIGFHRPTYQGLGSPAVAQTYSDSLRSLYDRAGVTLSFTDRTFSTPFESMWYPSYGEMLSANVLTRQTLGGETAVVSTIVRTRADYIRVMGQLPLWEPLRRKYPDLAERVIDAAIAAAESGGTDDHVFQAVGSIFQNSLHLIFRDASDDNLLRYMRLSLDQALAARAISNEACARLAQGRLNVALTLPAELTQRDLAIQTEALNSPPRAAPNITDEEIDFYLGMVAAGIPEDQLQAVAEPDQPVPASVLCEGSIAFIRAILALPDEPRAKVIRWSIVQQDSDQGS